MEFYQGRLAPHGLPGTINYKRKYEPDFPTVTIVNATPGRVMTTVQLDALSLVAAPEPDLASPVVPLRPRRAHGPDARERQWPDYQRSLAGAPPNREGSGPGRSHADFFWCMMAVQRGWSTEETARKLVDVSERARERVRLKDEGYALVTAENAAAAAAKGRQRSRGSA